MEGSKGSRGVSRGPKYQVGLLGDPMGSTGRFDGFSDDF